MKTSKYILKMELLKNLCRTMERNLKITMAVARGLLRDRKFQTSISALNNQLLLFRY